MRHARRGFTLVELLIAMILLFIVGGGIYSLLITVQRVSGRQTEMAGVQGNLRSGIQLIKSELMELNTNAAADSTDITAMSATAISYLAMRGIGETCGTPTTSGLKIRVSSYYGLRPPTATRDGLLLYLDTDTTKASDDVWIKTPISSVGSTTCPNGAAAWSVGATLTSAQVTALAAVSDAPGAGLGAIPVRTYETMEIGQVDDAGQTWLGIRSISSGGEATLVPVIGPLAADGVDLTYWDKNNDKTATRSAVKTILITLTGISDRPVSTGQGGAIGNPRDSLQVRVQLRNSK